MKKSSTLLLLVIAGGAAAWYFFSRKKSGGSAGVTGNNPKFTGTGTAAPPGFWSLGAAPGGLLNIKAPSNAPAWAQVASSSVNSLGQLAARYWKPNKSVETLGSSRGGADRTPFYSSLSDYDAAKGRAYAAQNEVAYGGVDAYYNGPDTSDPDVPDFNEDLL